VLPAATWYETLEERTGPGGAVLMRVMAQMGMVMNLDKCIGCHTCSVTCKQA
jgi:Fe-S-cluster-containing hydrogenase component 2